MSPEHTVQEVPYDPEARCELWMQGMRRNWSAICDAYLCPLQCVHSGGRLQKSDCSQVLATQRRLYVLDDEDRADCLALKHSIASTEI